MRWVVVIGILLRNATHLKSFTNLPIWFFLQALYLIYAIVISIILLRNPKLKQVKQVFFGQLFFDTLFCALFFILNGNLESDLFFNLLLPLLIIMEQVNTSSVLLFYYLAWCFLLLVSFIVMVPLSDVTVSYQEMFFNTFIPRVTLLLFIILFIINRNDLIRAQAGEL